MKDITISLLYGRGSKTISIPSGLKYNVLSVNEPEPIRDLERAFSQQLAQPIGSEPFDELFAPEDKVAILIPDKTRRCHSSKVLEIIISRLNKNRIPSQNITVLLARGSHSAHSPEEIKRLVGDRVCQSISVIDHDARNKEEMTYIGTTTRGTRVEINRYAAKSDKIIVVGALAYHYYAGFSGGRKLIIPGIAGFETIQQNHSLVLNKTPLKGKNPNACLGKLDDNPVSEDMIEAARLAKVDFSIGLALNSKDEVIKLFCGDVVKAHRKGCEFLDKVYRVKVKDKADFIIVSAGGYPSDINYIQTHKTIEYASYGLKENGKMLVLAECSEGIGSDIFLDWLSLPSLDEMENNLRKEFVVYGHTALCSLMKAKRFEIYLYSALLEEVIRKVQFRRVDDLQKTLNQMASELPESAQTFVIPRGNALVPFVPLKGD
jgi:nickel-dependent lactate racemase